MKIVVYTSIIGNIDKLWSVMPGSDTIQHIAFVDKPKREVGLWGGSPPVILPKTYNIKVHESWEQRIIEPESNARRTARHYKTVPHRYLPDADIWVWIDGNVRLRMTPTQYLSRYMVGDLCIFNHWDRKCLYEEAAFCSKVNKDKPAVLKAQVKRYKAAGMPKNWGLAATRIVVRKNTKKIRDLNEAWLYEIEHGSLRDQVSLPYVCWKAGLKWKALPGRCCPRNGDKRYHYIKHTRKR